MFEYIIVSKVKIGLGGLYKYNYRPSLLSQMTNHLTGGKVNLAILQESIRSELLTLVDRCDGSKVSINSINGNWG